jgi:protein-tyrosine phosphatase
VQGRGRRCWSLTGLPLRAVDHTERGFEVVFICTGNRFRSPIAEALLRASTRELPVRVRSLGTMRTDSLPALSEAIQLSRALGIDISGHRSRCLDGVDLGDTDLVIGFERNQVARAVIDAGADRRRTFLLGELVDSLEQVELPPAGDVVERASRAVEAAAALRAHERGAPASWEIADPFGRSTKESERIARRIAELTSRLARLLFAT